MIRKLIFSITTVSKCNERPAAAGYCALYDEWRGSLLIAQGNVYQLLSVRFYGSPECRPDCPRDILSSFDLGTAICLTVLRWFQASTIMVRCITRKLCLDQYCLTVDRKRRFIANYNFSACFVVDYGWLAFIAFDSFHLYFLLKTNVIQYVVLFENVKSLVSLKVLLYFVCCVAWASAAYFGRTITCLCWACANRAMYVWAGVTLWTCVVLLL